eukprot:TRINITY_DN7715_c0_g1_i1.p1 TRINITY_DN7715_c0_g1~~TRINITY_DN7715_c0_g1_i1.p1  ORF type:complete len:546 (+),score=79.46 TRINITY_DN7715_c0_g1_i1:90-1727(+)
MQLLMFAGLILNTVCAWLGPLGPQWLEQICSTGKSLLQIKQTKSQQMLAEDAEAGATPTADPMMTDLFEFWDSYRDARNGAYCDFLSLRDDITCSNANNFYSLAAVGMGLVTDAVFAELGFISKSDGQARALQTIKMVRERWPKSESGWYQHFTNQKFEVLSEYSTIDTAIGALGALLAGNYFGGDVKTVAEQLANTTDWASAIKGTKPDSQATTSDRIPPRCANDIRWGYEHGRKQAWYANDFGAAVQRVANVSLNDATFQDMQRLYKCLNLNSWNCGAELGFPSTCSHPPCNTCLASTIYMVSDSSGVMSGPLEPFNEYYLVSYLAAKDAYSHAQSPTKLSKDHFNMFFGSTSGPKGDGKYPVHIAYEGINLLTDHPNNYMPSFHVQFCHFLTKGFGQNPYYQKLFQDAMLADMKFWESNLPSDLLGKVWGLGAGTGPGGYKVNSISANPDLIYSAAIMAGFLKANAAHTSQIEGQLRSMYTNDLCTYTKKVRSGRTAKVPWRCSAKNQQFRAPQAESVDFSTTVLGFAQLFLPEGFYQKYAA